MIHKCLKNRVFTQPVERFDPSLLFMPDLVELFLIGFFISFLIGLSGMGGGALLMPALVIGMNLPPPIAVGSSLAFSFFVKVFGSFYHYKQANVRLVLIKNLSLGSIPGVLCGTSFLEILKIYKPQIVDSVIMKSTGLILIIIPLIILIRFLMGIILHNKFHTLFRLSEANKLVGFVVGLTGGFLVGFTSIGGGTIIIMLLTFFFSLNSRELVGTDIFHSAILCLFAALLHLFLGNVDFPIVVKLLIGAIPGIYLGCRICYIMPNRLAKGAINLGLIYLGIKIFMG